VAGWPAVVRVRPAATSDHSWIERFLADNHSSRIARRGQIVQPLDHSMLIAEADGAPAGLLTYIVDGDSCEILTLHAVRQWAGTGSALIESVKTIARQAGCRTLWLLTTNDNVDALRFYQRRGFRLRVARPGAVDEARRTLKPEIPTIGEYGIPLRDEIELEQQL
jgi:N-acetylglutamate synthase-like GNAT family acetyltransferase